MSSPSQIKTFTAEAAIAAFTIVKPGTSDGNMLAAAAVSDKLYGVSDPIGQSTVGGRVEVIIEGEADVLYGGTVTRGDLVTSDASGRAVTAAPGAGTNNRIIGVAKISGVVGDVGTILVAPSMMQG